MVWDDFAVPLTGCHGGTRRGSRREHVREVRDRGMAPQEPDIPNDARADGQHSFDSQQQPQKRHRGVEAKEPSVLGSCGVSAGFLGARQLFRGSTALMPKEGLKESRGNLMKGAGSRFYIVLSCTNSFAHL